MLEINRINQELPNITQYLFSQFSNDETKSINQLQTSKQCVLFQRIRIQSQQCSMDNPMYQIRYILLQLREDYILQVNQQTKEVLSGFKCNIDISYKLIRATVNQPDEVGDLLGIQFNSQKWNKKSIFLYVADTNRQTQAENLRQLSQELGTKYIIQHGFHEIYRAIKKIGKGVTASVYKALRLTDKSEVAVKSFKKQLYYQIDNGRGKAAFQKQFKAMTELTNTKYTCKLIAVYESDNSIYIVMKLLQRSLYSYLKINGFPSPQLAKQLMAKILIGLESMHQKELMHRDLKLQNIMVLEQDKNCIVPIIIDLGLAQKVKSQAFLYIKCGTPGYVAPQILNIKPGQVQKPPYGNKCDVFSIGVIFYILLAGKTIFEGNDERDVVRKNRQCQIDYNFPNDDKLSFQMKDLLSKMLQKNPLKRSSVKQILSHNFFKGQIKLSQTASSII